MCGANFEEGARCGRGTAAAAAAAAAVAAAAVAAAAAAAAAAATTNEFRNPFFPDLYSDPPLIRLLKVYKE